MVELETKKPVGRYAPSPTGDLHLGNLRTALLSWLQVRLLHGRYLMRMEDLDTPRVVAGSSDQILYDIEWLGLDWDGEVMYQSQRHALYSDALFQLQEQGLIYPCYCSRKDIQQAMSAPHNQTAVYPNICRELTESQRAEKALSKTPAFRIKVPSRTVKFTDQLLGEQSQNIASHCGDFVVKRADSLYAYQLAVVIDDAAQGVTHVLRGADLLSSTARQLHLFDLFDAKRPDFLHVELMNDDAGERMSKRGGAYCLKQWRDDGKSAQQLVALLAHSVGLTSSNEPISVTDLLTSLDYSSFVACLQSDSSASK